MPKLLRLLTLFVCTTVFAQTPLATQPGTSPITDPKQITSKVLKREVQPFSIEKLYTTRLIGATSWSPDGKQIAFVTNISGRNNIWLISSDGGWPSQLTISDERQTEPAWSPNGKWISFASDHDGDEQWDLFLVSAQSGEVVNLSNTPDVAEQGQAWSPDSRYLAYMWKPRSSPNFEIELMDVLTKRYRAVTKDTPKNLSNTGPIWSGDGKTIAFTQQDAAAKNSNIFLIEVASGKATLLTPHIDQCNYQATAFSPDSKYLLITSNAKGYDSAALLEVATRKIDWLTNDKREIGSGNFSPDSQRLTWTENVEGDTQIFVYDIASRQTTTLPAPAGVNTLAGSVTSFSPAGQRLLYYHNGPTSPNDLWVYDFTSKQSKQLTHSLLAGISTDDMVEPFLVQYPSRDGKRQISAFVYVPHNAPRDHTHPAIVLLDGGPHSQIVNNFNRTIQYLANQGYVVIAPNCRGSKAFGKEFADANRYDTGESDLEDVLAAADWIQQTGYIDPKKLVVMGSSYGGYVSMMALTKAPATWAAGIAIVPVGPINFTGGIKAPVLLFAGGNDPRYTKAEAQQVTDAIRKQGGSAELKIYENEGHEFARVENQIDAYTRVAAFLNKYVPAPPCGCAL